MNKHAHPRCLFAQLEPAFLREIAGMRPVATVPLHPVTEPCDLPTDRSDFTRDVSATGV